MPKIAETEFEKLLLKGLKLKPQQKGEDRATYVKRVAKALLALPEEKQEKVFDKLDEAGQAWYNNLVQAVNDKTALPDFVAAPAKGKKGKKEAEPEPEDEEADTDNEPADSADDGESAADDDLFGEEEESAGDGEEEDGGGSGEEETADGADSDPFGEDSDESADAGESEEDSSEDETDGAEDFLDDDEPAEKPAKAKVAAKGKQAAAPAPKAKAADVAKDLQAAKALREMVINNCSKVLKACETDEGAKKALAALKAKLAKAGHTLNPANEVMYFYGTIAVLRILDEKGYLQFPEA